MATVLEITTEQVYRNLGFTEDVTECGCCGRVDLKGTYAIENLQTGEITYFGCVCAAHRMNWSKKEFVTRYKVEEKQQTEAARKEYANSQEKQAYNGWQDQLNTRFPDVDADWDARMIAIRTEKPLHMLALENLKLDLFKKYPLVKYIY